MTFGNLAPTADAPSLRIRIRYGIKNSTMVEVIGAHQCRALHPSGGRLIGGCEVGDAEKYKYQRTLTSQQLALTIQHSLNKSFLHHVLERSCRRHDPGPICLCAEHASLRMLATYRRARRPSRCAWHGSIPSHASDHWRQLFQPYCESDTCSLSYHIQTVLTYST